jgi:hypothetical protein
MESENLPLNSIAACFVNSGSAVRIRPSADHFRIRNWLPGKCFPIARVAILRLDLGVGPMLRH